jgi:hypothetical protein
VPIKHSISTAKHTEFLRLFRRKLLNLVAALFNTTWWPAGALEIFSYSNVRYIIHKSIQNNNAIRSG